MKSRVLLYVFAIVVIVAFVAWIARNTYWDDVNVAMPMRGEAVGNPFYSVQRFAESLGVHWAGTSDQKPSAQLARTGRAASKTRQLSSAVRDLLNQGTVRDGECAASVLVRGMQPRGAGVRHTLC